MGPTQEDFQELGWNFVDVNNHVLTERATLQLLSLIGQVLVQIRDRLPIPEEQHA